MTTTPAKNKATKSTAPRKKTAAKRSTKKAVGDGASLVIVESPAKARTIEKYLGPGYTVMASIGHVIDLPKSKLGVDVEHDFSPEYAVIRGKATVLKEMKSAAKKAKCVYLAPDPDREGEAIAWHIAEYLKDSNDNIRRATFNEITKPAVKAAIENPREIDINLFNAQQARRVLDRLVGFKVSQVLWRKISWGLSAGRVQSVAVRLVCEREAERDAFTPEEYWTIDGRAAVASPPPFTIRLAKIDGKKASIGNKEQADAILNAVRGRDFVVGDVKKRDARKRPFAPFITSTLQQEASRRLRMTARRTMALAQQLYEGIDLGSEGSVGLITYMRTDSTRLAGSAIAQIRDFIGETFDTNNNTPWRYLPEAPRQYTKKAASAQDAHEAIRPTDASLTPERVAKYLDKDQLRLYELIWKRTVASQMSDALLERTQVEIPVENFLFTAHGSVQKFDGFLKLYQEATDEIGKSESDAEGEEKVKIEGDETLPKLAQGDKLTLENLKGDQHFTQPPPRFTEAGLIKELEKQGIGRPSTYASIISVIQDRKYVVKEKGAFRPEELGVVVNDWLKENFPTFMEVKFTAEMEQKLDHVEEGSQDWVVLMKDFYGPFSGRLNSAEEAERWHRDTKAVCPQCGAKMKAVWGRNGLYLSCSQYPDCKSSAPAIRDENGEFVIAPEELTDEKCPNCGETFKVKNGRYGRFLACPAEDCKTTAPYKIGVPCGDPACTGQLVERRSARGMTFYSCNNYPNCRFSLFEKPYRDFCEETGQEEWFVYTGNKKQILCCDGDKEVSIKKAHENQYVARKKTAKKGSKKSSKKASKKSTKGT